MESKGIITHVPFVQLRPGQFQPRTIFEKKALERLADSIRAIGIQQPLKVRPLKSPTGIERYEIVAGERRWRAAQIAELIEVPVYIEEMTDEEAAVAAIAENENRTNLNPIDAANAYQRLMQQFDYSLDQTAKSAGASKPHICNMLRLLKLPEKIQRLVKEGVIKKTHAKMIVSLPPEKQEEWAIAAQTKSSHAFERALKQAKHPKKILKSTSIDPDTAMLQKNYSDFVGSPTRFIMKDKKIIIEIICDNNDIFDGVLIKTGFKINGGYF